MIGDFNDESNLPHKLLLTDTQVSKLCKAFASNSSVNINLSKTQLSEMVQLGGISLPLIGLHLAAVLKGGTEAAKHTAPTLVKNSAKYFVNKGIN